MLYEFTAGRYRDVSTLKETYNILNDVQDRTVLVGNQYAQLCNNRSGKKQQHQQQQHQHMDNMATFRALRRPFRELGILCKYHSPERHVRRAEAAIKHIKRLFRAQILALSFACPFEFYPWAIDWAVDSSNLTLHADNNYKTPFTRFTGTEVKYENHLRYAFGDIVETPTHDNNPTTDESRTTVGIIVGREDSMRGTMIIKDLATSKFIKRREGIPIQINRLIEAQIRAIGPHNSNTFHDSADDTGHLSATIDNEGIETATESDEVNIDAQMELHHVDDTGENHQDENRVQWDNYESDNNDATQAAEEHDSEEPETYQQPSEVEDNVEDYRHNSNSSNNDRDNINNNNSRSNIRANNNNNNRRIEPALSELRRSPRPQKFNRKYFEIPPEMYDQPSCMIASADNSINNTTDNLKISQSIAIFGYEETVKSIRNEIEQMFRKEVWELVSKDKYVKKVIPTKLFLKAKFDSEGNYEKLKSRLVACGHLDNDKGSKEENAAPTVNINTVMLQLAVAAKHNLDFKVFDIGGAYLHANLEKDKYIRINSEIVELLNLDPENKYKKSDGSVFAKLKNACMVYPSLVGSGMIP